MIEFLFFLKRKLFAKVVTLIFTFSFKKIGRNCWIYKPSIMHGLKYITLGDGISIFDQAWLMGINNSDIKPSLNIGSNTDIGRFSHIIFLGEMKIGANVLIADKVYISDTTHNFNRKDLPIKKQGIYKLNNVSIGDGSWIGENVIIYGCKIGKNCVIGANSFVNSDIPDNSVAVGNPAKVIKKIC